jgi:hypothetical protein
VEGGGPEVGTIVQGFINFILQSHLCDSLVHCSCCKFIDDFRTDAPSLRGRAETRKPRDPMQMGTQLSEDRERTTSKGSDSRAACETLFPVCNIVRPFNDSCRSLRILSACQKFNRHIPATGRFMRFLPVTGTFESSDSDRRTRNLSYNEQTV